jgi:hypothetical protein
MATSSARSTHLRCDEGWRTRILHRQGLPWLLGHPARTPVSKRCQPDVPSAMECRGSASCPGQLQQGATTTKTPGGRQASEPRIRACPGPEWPHLQLTQTGRHKRERVQVPLREARSLAVRPARQQVLVGAGTTRARDKLMHTACVDPRCVLSRLTASAITARHGARPWCKQPSRL